MGQPLQDKQRKILGKGLWSVVYDQGDETVIKYTRAECAGIGNGVEKIQHEIACLKALEKESTKSFGTPSYFDCGDVDRDDPLYADGYRIWSITRKISGRSISLAEIRKFSVEISHVTGRNLGVFLAALHRDLNNSQSQINLEKSLSLLKSDIQPYLHPEDTAIFDYLEQMWSGYLPAMSYKIHGDFNISNILFDNQNKPIAVLDWAEACWGFPEWDIISIVGEIPNLAESMISAYEEAAGIRVSNQNIEFSEKLRAIFSYLIARRPNNEDHFSESQSRLRGLGIAV